MQSILERFYFISFEFITQEDLIDELRMNEISCDNDHELIQFHLTKDLILKY